MPINEKDLQRLGINREEWEAHEARMAAEEPLEVRVVGGHKALSEALEAAGLEATITNHMPHTWTPCA